MSRIFMPFEIKMEIFKLFSPEWAVLSPHKVPALPCNCPALNQQLQEKNRHINELETKLLTVQTQLDEYALKQSVQQEKQDRLKETNEEYLKLVSDYDGIVSNLIQERDVFKSEKDIVEKHLANLELSFSDLHAKFARAKIVVDGYKQNEEVLVDSLKENENSILELQRRYDSLKTSAEMRLQDANEALHRIKGDYENEINKRNTKIKKQDVVINSLEQCIKQKKIENEKLCSICDEFIYKQKDIL